MRRFMAILLGALLLALAAGGASLAADPKPNPAATDAATADKVRLLLDLAADPAVRSALEARLATASTPPAPEADTMAGGLGNRLQMLRSRIRVLAEAVPQLPHQVSRAGGMLGDMLDRSDAFSLLLFVPVFVALGFGGEWLFRRNMRRFGTWLLALPLATVRERVSAVFVRLLYSLGIVGSFALGSLGAMLPFDWTNGMKQVLLGLLLACLFTRFGAVIGRFLLAPGAPRFRVVPVGQPAAIFLYRRLVVLGLLFGIGSQMIAVLAAFGFDEVSQDLCTYALGIGILAMMIEIVWRCPRDPLPSGTEGLATAEETAALPQFGHPEWRRFSAGGLRVALTVSFLLLWGFWVAGAATLFWLLLFAIGLPSTVILTQRSVRHVMRPTAVDLAAEANRLTVILLERGVRTLLIAGGGILLAHLIGLDVTSMTMRDAVSTRIMRGIIGVAVVLLVADFLWHIIAAVIDRRLSRSMAVASSAADGGVHAARLQTLLPILKNLSLAILAVVTVMMVLGALGVEIGPLIASAGVVGVAIGFGAQTLVKDIISGIFYLVDDAFRIGEYIQSGTYKGTVESFSLRSVKLRHQRGALYTIPFGTLGAVQNQSRDWVVDKITLNLPYATDLDRVRKIIKGIGQELLEDPDLGPEILNPLKLQGVSQFGDFAVQLQTKMMTKPGDVQFAARRRALALIKREFQAQGIGFALPQVQVSGEGSEAAAASRALSLVKTQQASAAE